MTPQELADQLIGTCRNVFVEEELDNEGSVQDLEQFDSLCFCCAGCGWWCSTEELHNDSSGDLWCEQCHEEGEDEV